MTFGNPRNCDINMRIKDDVEQGTGRGCDGSDGGRCICGVGCVVVGDAGGN